MKCYWWNLLFFWFKNSDFFLLFRDFFLFFLVIFYQELEKLEKLILYQIFVTRIIVYSGTLWSFCLFLSRTPSSVLKTKKKVKKEINKFSKPKLFRSRLPAEPDVFQSELPPKQTTHPGSCILRWLCFRPDCFPS